MTADTAGPLTRGWSWVTIAVPLVVLAIAAVVIIDAGSGTTFFYDEWIWIMQRHSVSEASLLEPFNNHLMALPIATYQVLYRLVGLDSPVPYRLLLTVFHLATCGLLYVYLRRRVRWVVALAGAAVLAFFGYTWPVIIWPISLGWVYATTAGIGALLLLDRDSRRADVVAMLALIAAVLSSGIGVPFVIGIGVELLVRRAWKRLYVAVVPGVLFAAWYLAYATGTSDSGTVGQILDFGESLLAQTFGTLLGIDDRGTAAHVVLAVVFVGIIVLWFALGRPHSPRFIGNVAALASFTLLLSYSRATSGLTQWHSYAAAVFVLLVLGELVAGRELGVVPTVAVVAVVVWSIIWNLGELAEGSDLQRRRAEEMRAQLAAVELVDGAIDPNRRVGRFLPETRAGPWLDVSAAYGSPAYTLDELREAPVHARRAANRLATRGSGVRLEPVAEPVECGPDTTPGPHELVYRAGDEPVRVFVGLVRPGVPIGTIPANEVRRVTIPSAWLDAGAPVTVRADGGHPCTITGDL